MNKKEWQNNLISEMRDLIRLGVNIPLKAFKLAEKADPKNFVGMSETEVVDALIFSAMSERN